MSCWIAIRTLRNYRETNIKCKSKIEALLFLIYLHFITSTQNLLSAVALEIHLLLPQKALIFFHAWWLFCQGTALLLVHSVTF